MKYPNKQSHNEEEEEEAEVINNKTIVVGMKMDQQSKELLTWVLVKVAQSGDSVLALHVLNNTDQDGNSPLLALFQAFDSVLSVYEGFCNLKQVDLKLKICRGSSACKVLVQEVKAYCADKIIVGTKSKNRHSIRSSASVAKYLAKKLPKECSVIAVSNGKVLFQREWNGDTKNGMNDQRRKSMLLAIQRTLSRSSKVLNDTTKEGLDKKSFRTFGEELLRTKKYCCEGTRGPNCSICGRNSSSVATHCAKSAQEFGCDGGANNALALVTEEAGSDSVSLDVSELIELKPGWPLLRQPTVPNCKTYSRDSVRKMSVVQWAMQLPNRQSSLVVINSDSKHNIYDQDRYQVPSLDAESGALVPVGIGFASHRSSLDEESKGLPEELECLHEKYSSTCRLFEYQELVLATSNFMPEKLIGKGGCSKVYRGCLPDGKEIAVKMLNASDDDAVKEFVLEIEIITALHHNNIISLVGFCFEDCNLLLVYDFLSRGSLEENLHGNENNKSLFDWGERYKVALGVANALQYLHTDATCRVIHRDVKSSNILLSDDFEPQLSDFGLAKWASTSSSHITCNDVAGTFGYMAPEYFMYGKVNEKIDVYAYGVVLLEILSGRKPISNDYPKGQESLVMWANPILNGGKAVQLLDPVLEENYDSDQMDRMVLAATLCLRRSPQARPQMSIVLKLLQGDVEVTKQARQQVLAHEEFDGSDNESIPPPNMQSHINLALLDVDDDHSLSFSSIEQGPSLENYLQGRCSRSSSFD